MSISRLAPTVLVQTLGRQEPSRIWLRIVAMPPMSLTTGLALSFEMFVEVYTSN